MIHPATTVAMISPGVGLGVVARQPIPRGTVTWVRDPLDRLLPADFVAALPSLFADLHGRFAYRDASGDFLLPWDDTRFMNHSCNCNCATTAFGFEIAIADIAAGEQLTNDYAMFNVTPDETLNCLCGQPNCRGLIGLHDRPLLEPAWHTAIAAALSCAGAVAQPLLTLLPNSVLASARHHYHQAHRVAQA